MIRVLLLSTMLVLVTAGCIGDKSESIGVPSTLAVGAYGELTFGDSCTGSKVDLCFNDTVESVDAITVVPPQPLEVLPAGQVPADLLQLWAYKGDYVAHGLAPGHATVCVQARYSDGTHRKACAQARTPSRAREQARTGCGGCCATTAPRSTP